MKAQLKGLVRDVFQSDKAPKDYVTLVDVETGGDVKLTFDRGTCPAGVGETIELQVILKGRLFNNSVGYEVVQVISPNGVKPEKPKA